MHCQILRLQTGKGSCLCLTGFTDMQENKTKPQTRKLQEAPGADANPHSLCGQVPLASKCSSESSWNISFGHQEAKKEQESSSNAISATLGGAATARRDELGGQTLRAVITTFPPVQRTRRQAVFCPQSHWVGLPKLFTLEMEEILLFARNIPWKMSEDWEMLNVN